MSAYGIIRDGSGAGSEWWKWTSTARPRRVPALHRPGLAHRGGCRLHHRGGDSVRLQRIPAGTDPPDPLSGEAGSRGPPGHRAEIQAPRRTGRAGPGITGMTRALATHQDEQRRDREQLSQLAFFDTLTGLHNRKAFYDRLGESLVQARRLGGKTRALLFLDLDNFKDVNDSLGHSVGDRVLQEVAAEYAPRAGERLCLPPGRRRVHRRAHRPEPRNRRGGGRREAHPGGARTGGRRVPQPPPRAERRHRPFPRDADSLDGLVRNADIALFEARSAATPITSSPPRFRPRRRRRCASSTTCTGRSSRGNSSFSSSRSSALPDW